MVWWKVGNGLDVVFEIKEYKLMKARTHSRWGIKYTFPSSCHRCSCASSWPCPTSLYDEWWLLNRWSKVEETPMKRFFRMIQWRRCWSSPRDILCNSFPRLVAILHSATSDLNRKHFLGYFACFLPCISIVLGGLEALESRRLALRDAYTIARAFPEAPRRTLLLE